MQQAGSSHGRFPSMASLRPRSMLFTLFGDYVYPGTGEIWLGSLVRIANRLGISEVAVRSAVARLAREGWIIARKMRNRSFYRLSASGRALIEEGTRRIYRTNGKPWDGSWCLLTYSIPETERGTRDRMRKRLAWLGFGALGGGVYIAARDVSADTQKLLRSHRAAKYGRVFKAKLANGAPAREIVGQCWDLGRIARAYEKFIRHYAALYRRDRRRASCGALSDAEAFVMRFALTHDYRRFPFLDPDLPDELLPRDWAGSKARTLFEAYHAMLTEGASRFFSASVRLPSVSMRRSTLPVRSSG